jgi:hypothetical protein
VFVGVARAEGDTCFRQDVDLVGAHGEDDLAAFRWCELVGEGFQQRAAFLDAALVDSSAPVIQDVTFQSNPVGPNPVINVTTNEDAIISIQYGTSTPPAAYADTRFGSSVAVALTRAQPNTTYYFLVIATDKAGNRTIANNQGAYYQLTTSVHQSSITVPYMYQTIQSAIDVAWDGTVITVYPGTYGPIDLKGKKITVTGSDPDNWDTIASIIIQAGGTTSNDFCVRTISGEARECVIRGVTLDAAGSNGGGLVSVASSPVLEKCRIAGYTAYGCYLVGGAPLITDCTFYQCMCTFSSQISKVEVRNCDISNTMYAFMLSHDTTHGLIANNVIHDCTSMAFWVNGLRNCPIINNVIYDSVIGIDLNEYTQVLISGNTIVGNTTAGINISGDTEYRFAYLGTHPTITNSILWNNGDDIVNGSVYTTPVIQYSCIEDSDTGTGVVHGYPYFYSLINKDFHIVSISPCYNTGDPDYEPFVGETDMDGNNRIIGSRIDMGAYELAD